MSEVAYQAVPSNESIGHEQSVAARMRELIREHQILFPEATHAPAPNLGSYGRLSLPELESSVGALRAVLGITPE